MDQETLSQQHWDGGFSPPIFTEVHTPRPSKTSQSAADVDSGGERWAGQTGRKKAFQAVACTEWKLFL